MAEEGPRYVLSFLFDQNQIDGAMLKSITEQALVRYLPDRIGMWIGRHTKHLVLTIKGTLPDVDNCHQLIAEKLIDDRGLHFMRLSDEAGDEIRRRGFVIVSCIEQQVRRFVNHALTIARGFDWWSALALPATDPGGDRLEPRIDKHSRLPQHPLECITFDSLVKIITIPVPHWADDRSISVSDLQELLDNCHTLDDVRHALGERVREETLYDQVFCHYFPDRHDWDTAKKALDWVLAQRNAIMHHRPVRLGMLKGLREHEKTIRRTLATAKPMLNDEELRSVREAAALLSREIWYCRMAQDVDAVWRPLSSQWAHSADLMRELRDFQKVHTTMEGPETLLSVLRKASSAVETYGTIAPVLSDLARALDRVRPAIDLYKAVQGNVSDILQARQRVLEESVRGVISPGESEDQGQNSGQVDQSGLDAAENSSHGCPSKTGQNGIGTPGG